jgi:hypothetical protein
MEGIGKRVTSDELRMFIESKVVEIEQIIFRHIEEQPREIAKAIVEEIDYYQVPMSLTVRRRTNETT